MSTLVPDANRPRLLLAVCIAAVASCNRSDRATHRQVAPPKSVAPAAGSGPRPVRVSDAGPNTRRASDLVDITTLDPTIRLDLRYATDNNFTGKTIYPVARCLLRRSVAEALASVQRALQASGLGLLLWDCYRPLSVQRQFWELVPDPRYVARPVFVDGVAVDASKHNRGAAVDLTLVHADGKPLPMPTDFDDFSERAHRSYAGGDDAATENSRRLEAAMTAAGFEPLPTEWWHFDGPGWREFSFEDAPLTAKQPGSR